MGHAGNIGARGRFCQTGLGPATRVNGVAKVTQNRELARCILKEKYAPEPKNWRLDLKPFKAD